MIKNYVNEFVSDKCFFVLCLIVCLFFFFNAAVAVTSKDFHYGGAIGEIR